MEGGTKVHVVGVVEVTDVIITYKVIVYIKLVGVLNWQWDLGWLVVGLYGGFIRYLRVQL